MGRTTRKPTGSPVCTACGLIRSVGFLNGAGVVSQPDPAPRDPGLLRGEDWYCTEECAEGHVRWTEGALLYSNGSPVCLQALPVWIEEVLAQNGQTTLIHAWAGPKKVYFGEYNSLRSRGAALHYARDRIWAEVIEAYPCLFGGE